MAATTDFLETAQLNHMWRGQASPRQDTYWLALCTTATDDTGGGTEVSTGVWTNYARASLDGSAASTIFGAPADESSGGGKRTANTSAISFGTPTITGSDPQVTHLKVMDASSGGNALKHGALATPKTISAGDPVSFPIGSLGLALR